MTYLLQQGLFVIRFRYIPRISGIWRKYFFLMSGMSVGRGTRLPKLYVTWPHQVSIGKGCILENGISFKFDGIWKEGPSIIIGDNAFVGKSCEFNIRHSIKVGNDSLIASGCKFIDHDHGVSLKHLMRVQKGVEMPIIVGKDVWLGCNVIVLKGVEIGDGAIIAAGAVVTKSIGPKEIWAGVPARKINERN